MSATAAVFHKRHPIRNFIIMPELQWPYIVRLLALINFAGVLMALSICVLFYWRYAPRESANAGLELANTSLMSALFEENLLDVLVPAFVVADFVSLAIGLWLSLYFSRKISVPIFRVRKWAEAITGGDFSYQLKFRPGDDLESLEEACNRVGATYRDLLEDLRRQVSELDAPSTPGLEAIKKTLGGLKT